MRYRKNWRRISNPGQMHLLLVVVIGPIRALVSQNGKQAVAIKGNRAVIPDIPVYAGLNDEESIMLYHWLHCTLLEESLISIKDGDSEAMDSLAWMFAPDYIDRITKVDGSRSAVVRTHQSDVPFSFYLCCKARQYDPASVRAGFIKLIPKLTWFTERKDMVKDEVLAFIKQFSRKEITYENSSETTERVVWE